MDTPTEIAAASASAEALSDSRRRPAMILSSVAFAIASSVMLGHVLDQAAMRRSFLGGVDMKFNAALGVFLLSIAVAQTIRRGAPAVTRAVAVLVFALGTVTLAEYALQTDLAIDEFFIRDVEGTATAPGRMAPTAALSLTLLASALLLMDARRAWLRRASRVTTIGVAALALVLLANVAFGGEARWSAPPFTEIAVSTVLALLLLSIALLIARADEGWSVVLTADTLGGQVFRRLAGPTLLIAPALMVLRATGQSLELFDENFGRSFILGATVAALALLLVQTAFYIHSADLQRRAAEQRLATAYEVLLRESRNEGATEKQELEASLESLAMRLANSNSELEAFTYSVSHDLRAPLRTLDGFSRELLDGYSSELDDRGRHYLTRIRAASQKMGTLIDDMLRLSRVGRAAMRHQDVDVSRLAVEIGAELREQDPGRTVDFTVEPGIVLRGGDPDLMRLALANLIGNAWKFTARTPSPRCEVGLIDGPAGRELVVRDNGAGFDMQYAGKLFTAFQRFHTTAEFEGTGVGLAIVFRVVSRHGGTIRAEAAIDKGAAFFIRLPNLEISK